MGITGLVSTPDEVVRFLARLRPFADLLVDYVDDVARDVVSASFTDGETILRQGAAAAPGLFVARNGIVDVVDGDHPVDNLEEGESFGLSAFLAQHRTIDRLHGAASIDAITMRPGSTSRRPSGSCGDCGSPTIWTRRPRASRSTTSSTPRRCDPSPTVRYGPRCLWSSMR